MNRRFSQHLFKMKQQRLRRVFRAAQLLQAVARGFLARRVYEPTLETRRVLWLERMQREAALRDQCAVRIQAFWKGYHARCIHGPELSALREARILENLKAKQELDRKLNVMATTVQANVRGYLVRKEYISELRKRMDRWREERDHKIHTAATKLQASWRGYITRERTRQLLLERRRERRAAEERRHRAAVVLQAYWRMQSCRMQFLQQRKSNKVTRPVCDKPSNEVTSPSGVGRLTVTKRLESALKLTSTPSQPCSIHTHSANQGSAAEEGEGYNEEVVEEEELAMRRLETSRQREETAARQARTRMGQVMLHQEKEKVM